MLFDVDKELEYTTKDARRTQEYYVEFCRIYKFTVQESEIFDSFPQICKFLYNFETAERVGTVNTQATRFSRWSSYRNNVTSANLFRNTRCLENTPTMHLHKLLYLDQVVYPILHDRLTTQGRPEYQRIISTVRSGPKDVAENALDHVKFTYQNNFNELMGKGKAINIKIRGHQKTFLDLSNIAIHSDIRDPSVEASLEKSYVTFTVKTSSIRLKYDKPSHFHTRAQIERILDSRLDDVFCNTFLKVVNEELKSIEEKSDEIAKYVQLASPSSLHIDGEDPEYDAIISESLDEKMMESLSKKMDEHLQEHFKKIEGNFDSSLSSAKGLVKPEYRDPVGAHALLKDVVKNQMFERFTERAHNVIKNIFLGEMQNAYNAHRPQLKSIDEFYNYIKGE